MPLPNPQRVALTLDSDGRNPQYITREWQLFFQGTLGPTGSATGGSTTIVNTTTGATADDAGLTVAQRAFQPHQIQAQPDDSALFRQRAFLPRVNFPQADDAAIFKQRSFAGLVPAAAPDDSSLLKQRVFDPRMPMPSLQPDDASLIIAAKVFGG